MTDSIAVSARSTATRIGKALILHGIDVRIAAGRWTAIVGPNGAGKSTLLRVLAGLLPTDGTVQLHGRPLADWPARERARQLAWLGQAEGGSDDLSAYDVVMLGRLPHRAWLAPASDADHAAVRQALAAMQVAHLQTRRLGELSGGERQRVLLARALAVQAPLLLMDEPLAHLDPPHQADWLAVVRAQVAAGGTVVSVLHELGMALQADELLIVKDGGIAHHGPCASPSTHRALQAAFDWRIGVYQVKDRWVALPRLPQPEHEHAD
ncbi:ABC transporter ATP-binding protein [Ottowia beijingensis]|jgi:iron complex transport system ATP-binding protein|uniref:ABC transporter ATP-binding protein n=1 Tax=Ottowia beijingensis TaxID=1207057 RepID=UPI00364209E8